MTKFDIADPDDPNTLVLPFIFVPHADPWPTEWLREHPGAARIPATFVPRAPAAGESGTRMDVSLALPDPVDPAAAPAAAAPAGFAVVGRGSAWPVDRHGHPWLRTAFGQSQRPLHEFGPGERTPGEAAPPEYGAIAETDPVAAYRAAEAVFADPGGAAGITPRVADKQAKPDTKRVEPHAGHFGW